MKVERDDSHSSPTFPFLGWNKDTGAVFLIQGADERGRYYGVVVAESNKGTGDTLLALGQTQSVIFSHMITPYPGTITLKN